MTAGPAGAAAPLDRLAEAAGATLSVHAGELGRPPYVERLGDVEHPSASTLKLPLLVAVQQAAEAGRLDLATPVEVVDTLPSAVPGQTYVTTRDYDNDDAVWERLGGTAEIAWLAERAIVRSSNLATNLLVDLVGTDAVAAVYAAAGATRSRFERGIQDAPAGGAGRRNVTTADDLAAVLTAILDGRLLPPARAREVEAVLARCEHDDALPAGLPPGRYVAHKPGWIDGACLDVGVVRPDGEPPLVVAICCEADLDDPAIHAVVAEAARVCWEHRPAAG